MKEHGRDRAGLRMHEADPQRWAAAAHGWRKLGADMVMLYPMYRIPKFEDQVETLRRFMERSLAVSEHPYLLLRRSAHPPRVPGKISNGKES
jgi:hypothetical protein